MDAADIGSLSGDGVGNAAGIAATREQIVALIPAHNEQDRLPATLDALERQTRRPDRIIVVSDNSTDATVPIARAAGAETYETVNNRHKKAGALNMALDHLALPDNTYVLIVDADSALSDQWIETALTMFTKQRVGAVGGIFLGDDENGWLGGVQGLEYARYRRELIRLRGEARVLTGTSTMMPMAMFRRIRDARISGELPGRGYYNLEALTEDFEITICVKRLGYRAVSPDACTVVTETMPTVSMLWRQRVRWQLGALDVLRMHGLNRVTRPYIMKQIETGLGIGANTAIWALALYMVLTGTFAMVPFWTLVGAVFYVERIHSALGAGRKGVTIASTMVMDIAFDMFISVVYVWCLVVVIRGGERDWGTSSIDQLAVEGAG
jgi:poly-beta-1,6-N-acetyl-D-glucosamine synthase